MQNVRALQVLETKIYGPQIKLQVTPLHIHRWCIHFSIGTDGQPRFFHHLFGQKY